MTLTDLEALALAGLCIASIALNIFASWLIWRLSNIVELYRSGGSE